MNFPIPENEAQRLSALRSFLVLDTPSEQEYDDITLLAAQICGTPIALISLIDENRQWFKSNLGLEVGETEREFAFCAHAIAPEAQTLIVNDATKDVRFAGNPLVTGDPKIRFYAGAPLITNENLTLGTLCVIDREPRILSDRQISALQALARQVTMKLELRRMSALLQNANDDLRNLSLTDDLTELYNRRGFMFHAEQQLKIFYSRRTDRGLWLLIADLDGLKRINDTFGHVEGSAVIVKAGEILRQTFREADVIGRFGGDEFVVLIINTLDQIKEAIAERLAANLARYNTESGKPYEISISYGMVPFSFDQIITIEDAIKSADAAMYQQKRRRQNER